jgi:hypothetical protein
MAVETKPKAANLICLVEKIPIVDSHIAAQSTPLERTTEDDGNPDISTDPVWSYQTRLLPAVIANLSNKVLDGSSRQSRVLSSGLFGL